MAGAGATLVAHALKRERNDKVVLEEISFTLAPGDRLGVVGPNGVGKTTLLRLLAGLDPPDAGRVHLAPPNATVGYLAQDRERPAGETVVQYLRRVSGLADAEQALEDASAAFASGDMSVAAQDAFDRALDRLSALAPESFEERAGRALDDLGAAPGLLGAEVATLSGGELARAHLVAMILSRYDIYLLDEPTNDLDFTGLERLEKLVTGWSAPAVVVSHDRAFLSRTVTAVLEIDAHTKSASYFDGGWDAYVREKEIAARLRQEAYEGYAKTRSDLLKRARREKQWATSGVAKEKGKAKDNDKVQRDFRVNRTEQLAARARRTEKAMERLETVEKPWEEWQLRYSLKSAPRAGAIVAELADAVVVRGGFRLGPVSITVPWGARLAVTGRNGGGKTTLVQALLGRLALESGRHYLGPGVMVGELGQERSGALAGAQSASEVAAANLLAPGRELLRSFMDASGLDVPEARTLLAKFGLAADHVMRPAWTLSPGERTRAQLACFQAVGVNFLVLDEPTNHLDMPAIEQLEEALEGYDGTLLVVTHDRKMLETLRVTERAEVAGGRVSVSAA